MNKDYAVKCKIDHGELYLSITHNGHQWASVAIKDREWEIPLIISELQRHLTRHSSEQAESYDCSANMSGSIMGKINKTSAGNPPAA